MFIENCLNEAIEKDEVEAFYHRTVANLSLFYRARIIAQRGNPNMKYTFQMDNIRSYAIAVTKAAKILNRPMSHTSRDIAKARLRWEQ